ncbi:hypothetical protein ACQR1Y_23730 [Bradyrhizobium sp. HKCCYLRH3099]|uniref:hypothetical protein n=1 Tax=unclassified Bradyrhizobium TaxID=2631580 RepID=UPI003EBB4302
MKEQVQARKEAAKVRLADMVLSAYSYSESRAGNPSMTSDWSLTDGKRHVILYVDEKTYSEQQDWKVLVRVQLESDPTVSLNQRPTRELHRSDFKLLKLDGDKKVYWTQREMTAEYLPDAAVGAIVAERRQAIDVILKDLRK